MGVLEDWGVLLVLKASHFSCPLTRLQGSQRPCVPPSRQGSILLAALVRPPGIIVAIGLMHRRVTPRVGRGGLYTTESDSHR